MYESVQLISLEPSHICFKNGMNIPLHEKELHDSYASPNIIKLIRENEMGGSCGMHGKGEKCIQSFGQKT